MLSRVRILVVVTRYPVPSSRGDQQRAYSWICELARRHSVSVVTAATPVDDRLDGGLPANVKIISVSAGPLGRALSAISSGVRGAPLQVGWMMPARTWRAAVKAMDEADVMLAMTTRSLRRRPTCALVIDHVDALSLNMLRRSRGPETPFIRAFVRFEAWRFAAWERRTAGWAQGALVTAGEDADALPSRPEAVIVPVGLDRIDPSWACCTDRPIDVVLSGHMRYPPNRQAALMLEREILPLLRLRREGLRIAVAGRGADTLGLRGVEVMADVPDMLAVLRRAKVAIVPLQGGTGSPYKVLEAAASGAAIVSSPWPAARFGIAARIASTAEEYCDAILELLDHPQARQALVADAQGALERHLTSHLCAVVERVLLTALER